MCIYIEGSSGGEVTGHCCFSFWCAYFVHDWCCGKSERGSVDKLPKDMD